MRNHKGDVRGFYITNRAYYSGAIGPREHEQEVMVGLFGREGGTSGEFAMRWYRQSDGLVPCLEAYCDAWSALASMPDLVAALAAMDVDGPRTHRMTVGEFEALLLRLGFADRTQYTPDYGS